MPRRHTAPRARSSAPVALMPSPPESEVSGLAWVTIIHLKVLPEKCEVRNQRGAISGKK